MPSAFISAVLPSDTKKNRAGRALRSRGDPDRKRHDIAATTGASVDAAKNRRRLNLAGLCIKT